MPILEEPATLSERRAAAEQCMSSLELDPIPSLVDDLDDAVSTAYAAWPDRLYLIGRDGRVAFHGFEGPAGFDLDGLEAAIVHELER